MNDNTEQQQQHEEHIFQQRVAQRILSHFPSPEIHEDKTNDSESFIRPLQHMQRQQRVQSILGSEGTDDGDWGFNNCSSSGVTIGSDSKLAKHEQHRFVPRRPKRMMRRREQQQQQQQQGETMNRAADHNNKKTTTLQKLDPNEMMRRMRSGNVMLPASHAAHGNASRASHGVQAERAKREVVLRVKRKRDDHALDELLIGMPDSKRQMVDRLSEQLDKVNMHNESAEPRAASPEHTSQIRRFTLLASALPHGKDSSDLLGRIRRLKDSAVVDAQLSKQKQHSKHQEHLRVARAEKLRRSRGQVSVIDVDLTTEQHKDRTAAHDAAMVAPFMSMLPSDSVQEAMEYVYDLYYLDDTYLPNEEDIATKKIVKIVDFDEELVFDNEYDNYDDDEEYDSEDSNASHHPNNDYPDEEEFEDMYNDEEGDDYGDANFNYDYGYDDDEDIDGDDNDWF